MQLNEENISSGTLLGLCNKHSYRVAVYLGDGLVTEIYEYKKGVKKAFDEIEEYNKERGNLNGFRTQCGTQSITEIVEIYEEIYVYEKMNIFELSEESKKFFSVMRDNFSEMDKFEPGDIITFDRNHYTHYAIFVDIKRFEIVHKISGPDYIGETTTASFKFTSCSDISKAIVKKESLINVIGTSIIKQYNKWDKKYDPRTKAEIVRCALERVGEIGYNLVNNNCQHFATECRYGRKFSPEVKFYKKLAYGGAAVFGFVAILGIAVIRMLTRS